MSPAEIIAYIGAASWLPQIARWAYRGIAKPRLSVRSAPTVDLRYDERGPIVRLTLSLSAERRDAIIDVLELVVRHEQGDERSMKWMLVGDIAGDIARDSSVPATALKITTATLVDRRVIFQDITFSSEIGKHKEAIISHFNFLRTTESDPLQALLKSKEVHEAREYFVQGYYWKPGRYTFEVRLRCKNIVHQNRFEVILSKGDCEILKKGCDLFEEYISASVMGSTGTPTASPEWRWVTLAINSSK